MGANPNYHSALRTQKHERHSEVLPLFVDFQVVIANLHTCRMI